MSADSSIIDLSTERRIQAAYSASDCTRWSPRDALVDMLKRVDSGEVTTDSLMIAWLNTSDSGEGASISFVQAMPKASLLDTFCRVHTMTEMLRQEVWSNGS